MSTYHRTRIAPTSSGFLHLGNVLSFAVTAALAKKTGAKLLLRIDDLDQARANDQYIADIFQTLNFMGIAFDEGPRDAKEFKANYSQLCRMESYHLALNNLREKGLVYACACSRKQLQEEVCKCAEKKIPLDTPETAWRLMTSKQPLVIKDISGEIITAQLPDEMRNFVVRKKDGFPAYQLTSVVDDLNFGMDLIVRGQDLWASTLAQHELARALGEDKFSHITFLHHPLLTTADGQKLSKSAGSTSIQYLRNADKSAAEIYSMIAALITGNATIANNFLELGKLMLK